MTPCNPLFIPATVFAPTYPGGKGCKTGVVEPVIQVLQNKMQAAITRMMKSDFKKEMTRRILKAPPANPWTYIYR